MWNKQNNLLIPQENSELLDEIPLGVYNVKYTDRTGFFLEKMEDFTLPDKIYGDTSVVNRWLTTYNNNPRNTGILLTGLKGSGKTLLAKKCALDSGLPIIMVTLNWADDEFITFITKLGNVCIFIDEFDKIYDTRQGITSILQLLDGVYTTHNLYILTSNELVPDKLLVNRPSRVRYHTHYESLSEDTVDEVINNLLINKEHTEDLKKVLSAIGIITFDLLLALIDEMNMFNESASESAKYLNVCSDAFYGMAYEIWKGKEFLVDSSVYIDLSKTLTIERNFSAIDDPEYMDEDYVKPDSNIKGLPYRVTILGQELVKKDMNTFEYNGIQGHFIIRKVTYRNMLVY